MTVLSPVRPSWYSKYTPRAGDGCVLCLNRQDDHNSSTLRDTSGNGNDGTIYGATWTQTEKGLWVLSYDGTDDYTDCGNDASLGVTTALTIETWVNFSKLPSAQDDNYPGIVSLPLDDAQLYLDKGNAKIFFRVVDTDSNYHYSSILETDISAGRWYHLVGATNGSTQDIYLNSVSKAPKSSGVPGVRSANCHIGRNGSWYLNALIGDEVRIYNRALSAEEIRDHYRYGRQLYGV
ncbi:MAG: LamG domain-containing protein [Halobacteriota archaeon]|nr:LamG domain-containing protein [Halobacteriota archaeon]